MAKTPDGDDRLEYQIRTHEGGIVVAEARTRKAANELAAAHKGSEVWRFNADAGGFQPES